MGVWFAVVPVANGIRTVAPVAARMLKSTVDVAARSSSSAATATQTYGGVLGAQGAAVGAMATGQALRHSEHGKGVLQSLTRNGPMIRGDFANEHIKNFNHIARLMPAPNPVVKSLYAGVQPVTPLGVGETGGFRIHKPGAGWSMHAGGAPLDLPAVDIEHLPAQTPGLELMIPGRASDVPEVQLHGTPQHRPSADDYLIVKSGDQNTLIIGGTGSLAPAIAQAIQARHEGAKVYATSRLSAPAPHLRIPGVEYIHTPNGLSDIGLELFEQVQPQNIFNLVNTDGPTWRAAYDVNVVQRYAVLDQVEQFSRTVDWNVRTPILSSQSVFRWGRGLDEDSPSNAQSNYGKTTYHSEFLPSLKPHDSRVRTPVLRLPTLVGIPSSIGFVPERANRLQLNNWVMQAANGEVIKVGDAPEAKRPYGFVSDVVDQIMNVMDHPDPQVHNGLFVLGRPGPHGQALSTQDTLRLVVDVVKEVDGRQVDIEYVQTPPRLGRRDITISTEKYNSFFPLQTVTPLATAIRALYLAYRGRNGQ